MNLRSNRRLMTVWLILSAITLGYLGMDSSVDHAGRLVASSAVTVGAIVLALVKVRLIFREFMGVRNAPVLLGRLTDAWVVLIGIGLLASYLIGRAIR